MKIIISGKPKEIAELADAMQRRTTKRELELRTSKEMEDFKAMKKSYAFVKKLQAEGWDPGIRASEGESETL